MNPPQGVNGKVGIARPAPRCRIVAPTISCTNMTPAVIHAKRPILRSGSLRVQARPYGRKHRRKSHQKAQFQLRAAAVQDAENGRNAASGGRRPLRIKNHAQSAEDSLGEHSQEREE